MSESTRDPKTASRQAGEVLTVAENKAVVDKETAVNPKIGEYTLHLYLIDTCKINHDSSIDAIMGIDAMGERKFTRIWKGIGPSSRTRWDEHFFFRKRFQSREELEEASFTITLYNRMLMVNRPLGSVRKHVFNVINKINEPQINTWTVFTDPENDFGVAKGWLRFSMTFSLSTVEQVDLETLSLREADQTMVDIPPEISVTHQELRVHLYRGRNILGIESSGKSDPMVNVSLGGIELKSGKVMQASEPTFYQTLFLRYIEPTLEDRVYIRLYDYNRLAKDVKLGSIALSLTDIKNGFYSVPKWHHFYGASAHSTNEEVRKKMIEQPDFASTFIGELYMAVTSQSDPKANLGVEEMVGKYKALESSGWQQVTFVLQLDVEYVYNLDVDLRDSSRIEVCMEWGTNASKFRIPGKRFENKLLIVSDGFIVRRTFDINFSSVDEVEMNREVYKQIPDVFVYVRVNGRNVSFYRFEAIKIMTNVTNFRADRTLKMKPDMAMSDMTIDGAGIMKVKVGMREEPRGPQFVSFFNRLREIKDSEERYFKAVEGLGPQASYKEPSPAYPVPSSGQIFPRPEVTLKYQNIVLLIQLFQAKDLVNVQKDNLPDTFVDFYHFGSNVRSKLIKDSLNPYWCQQMCLRSYRVNSEVPNLVVNLFDQEKSSLTGTRNQLIGWQEIRLSNSDYTENEYQLDQPNPRWVPLKVVGDIKAGQILISVKWCMQSTIRTRRELVSDAPRDITFTSTPYHCKINLLSLRDLKPRSMFMPNNTEVIVDTSPLFQQQGGEQTRFLQMPSDTVGVNPMYRRNEYFTGNLPEEMYLVPSIPGRVNDKAFTFFPDNRNIGNFMIDLSLYSFISKVELIAKLEALRENRETVANQAMMDRKHQQVMAQLDGILKHLKINLDKHQAYIEERNPDVMVQVTVMKEDTKKTVKQRLIIGSIELIGPMFMAQFAAQQPKGEGAINNTLLNDTVRTDTGLVIPSEREKQLLVGSSNLTASGPKMLEARKAPGRVMNALGPTYIVDGNYGGQGEANIPLPGGNDAPDFGFGGSLDPKKPGPDTFMLELFKKQGEQQEQIVLTPDQFKNLKADEKRKFTELGYKNSKVNTLHYRLFIDSNLESSQYMGVDRFTSVPIYRGRTFLKAGSGFFDFLDSKLSEQRIQTGLVRARVEMIQQQVFDELAKTPLSDVERYALDIPAKLEDWRSNKMARHEQLKHKVWIYIYIIDATFSVNMDAFSKNDAYVKIKLDSQEIKGRRVVQDNSNPRFMERFELECSLRDSSLLEVQFWDEDIYFDDYIGSTKIELMRRFFDKRMRARDDHPIEKRELTDNNGNRTGIANMWIDFYKEGKGGKMVMLSEAERAPWVIDPRPLTPLYVRGVVWDITNMPIFDATGAADYVVVISIPALNLQQKTDTHLRSTDGDGSFNWRFEFQLNIDFNFNYSEAKVNFRVFDKEVFTFNKFLADLEIDFADMVQQALETDEDQKMMGPTLEDEGRQDEKFMKAMALAKGLQAPNAKGRSKIQLSLEVLTQKGKDMKPAGLGRSHPNDYPYLPPPEGRIQWSWNPIKLFQQMFGKNCKQYCCLIIIAIILILLLGYFVPILVSSIISRAIIQ